MNVHSEESCPQLDTKQGLKQKRMEIGISQIDNTTLVCIILLPKFNNINFSHIYITSLLQSLHRFRQASVTTEDKAQICKPQCKTDFLRIQNKIKILTLHLRGLQISLCILKSLYTVM